MCFSVVLVYAVYFFFKLFNQLKFSYIKYFIKIENQLIMNDEIKNTKFIL